jgi:hypothetical protein
VADAFPLQWPDGWARTQPSFRQVAPYKMEPSKVLDHLRSELRRMRATSVVISSCLQLRRDGLPYTDQRQPDDVGVAVYWSTNKFKDRVIACDKWTKVFDNMHALGLAIDALRAIERSGATQVLDRAFTAFGALPAGSATVQRPWWEVLGLKKEALSFATLAMVEAQWRELAAKAHPDRGGDPKALVELNQAREQARAHYGAR